MSNPPFSSDEKKNQSEYKLPDEIIINDRSANVSDPFSSASEEKRSNQIHEEQSSENNGALSLRFLCFLGLIFCLIYGLGMFILSLIITLLAVVTLFQNSGVNDSLLQCWQSFFNTLVAGIGFALGLIIPPLGLGFLVVYFSLVGEKMDTDILSKIIKRSYKNK